MKLATKYEIGTKYKITDHGSTDHHRGRPGLDVEVGIVVKE